MNKTRLRQIYTTLYNIRLEIAKENKLLAFAHIDEIEYTLNAMDISAILSDLDLLLIKIPHIRTNDDVLFSDIVDEVIGDNQ